MIQGVGAAVDVLETVNEGSSQAQERVGPARTQLCGLAERCDCRRQFALGVCKLTTGFSCLPVDPVQVTLAIAEGGPELRVVISGHGNGAR